MRWNYEIIYFDLGGVIYIELLNNNLIFIKSSIYFIKDLYLFIMLFIMLL